MALFDKKTKEEKKDVEVADKKEAVKKTTTKKATTKTDKKDTKTSMKDLYSKDSDKKIVKGSKTKGTRKTDLGSNAYRILVKPLITEKGGDLNSLGKYLFEVAKDANKVEVAKAIFDVYGIRPAKVNMIRYEGKRKQRGKTTGKRKDWKKAIVTLPKGKTLDVYEGV